MLCQNPVHNLPERRHTVALRYLQIYLWLNAGGWPESNGLAFRNVLVSSGVDAWYPDTGYRYGDTGDLVSGWAEYWSETYCKAGYSHCLYTCSDGASGRKMDESLPVGARFPEFEAVFGTVRQV